MYIQNAVLLKTALEALGTFESPVPQRPALGCVFSVCFLLNSKSQGQHLVVEYGGVVRVLSSLKPRMVLCKTADDMLTELTILEGTLKVVCACISNIRQQRNLFSGNTERSKERSELSRGLSCRLGSAIWGKCLFTRALWRLGRRRNVRSGGRYAYGARKRPPLPTSCPSIRL